MEAGRRLTTLQTRVTQDTLFGFAGRPIEVGFLIRTSGDTHTPGTALILTDQHDTILSALVDSTGRTGSHATGIQAVVTNAWEIEKDHPLQLVQLLLLLFSNVF